MNAGHKKKQIFLVDDHPLVREWLTNLINQQSDLVVSGEADNAPAAVSAVNAAKPDLVIVDVSLKNSSGLELIKSLKELSPDVPTLVLSMYDESLYAERALRAGARGYINKSETAQKVVEAIHRVLEGKLFMSEKLAETMAARALTGQPPPHRSPVELLSDRELEAFEKLGQGLSTKQIAADLGVSVKTVEAYCARIKKKLNVTRAVQLLREAIRWNETRLPR